VPFFTQRLTHPTSLGLLKILITNIDNILIGLLLI
jgi:hypothetical protein